LKEEPFIPKSESLDSCDEQRKFAYEHLIEGADLRRLTAETCLDPTLSGARLISEAFRRGNKVLICGNGGSAADSQHMAAEFVNRLSQDFERPGLPAIALTTDTSFLTAYANDYGYDGAFERQVRALGKADDVLIGISTSGNSTNVVRAVAAAGQMAMKTIGLLGEGGKLTTLVDQAVVVPSRNTQHVQEVLLAIEHTLCFLVERSLFDPK